MLWVGYLAFFEWVSSIILIKVSGNTVSELYSYDHIVRWVGSVNTFQVLNDKHTEEEETRERLKPNK